MSEAKRATRVADRVREELMALLLRGIVKDPGAAGAHVSRVEVTDDLREARVYVRLLATGAQEAEQRRLVAALGRATGFLRRELGARLKLRYTPELRFFWDEGIDHALRMEALLQEIADERGADAADGAGGAVAAEATRGAGDGADPDDASEAPERARGARGR